MSVLFARSQATLPTSVGSRMALIKDLQTTTTKTKVINKIKNKTNISATIVVLLVTLQGTVISQRRLAWTHYLFGALNALKYWMHSLNHSLKTTKGIF